MEFYIFDNITQVPDTLNGIGLFVFDLWCNSLPNDKILDRTKFKHLQTTNIAKRLVFLLDRVEKHHGKSRKCRFQAFSPVSTIFSKAFFPRVVRSRDCEVRVNTILTARVISWWSLMHLFPGFLFPALTPLSFPTFLPFIKWLEEKFVAVRYQTHNCQVMNLLSIAALLAQW